VIVHAAGLEFEIVESDLRRVKRVRVHLKNQKPAEQDPAGSETG
jgi:CBS domain containing-hemolysin-like protein